MLFTLSISQFALIEALEVEFGPGLNILTGETGAGKSILVEALGLALGDRADTTMVRSGARKSVVEAGFRLPDRGPCRAFLDELDIEWWPDLIVRREVSARGQSRCFVNDTPVTVSALKDLGRLLVDLHGQHEHQSLLYAENHRGMLDAFSGLGTALEKYQAAFANLKAAVARLKELERRQRTADERRAVAEFHLKEIHKVDPHPGELENVEKELRVAEHAEHLATSVREALEYLYEGERAVSDGLGRSRKLLEEVAGIDGRAESWLEECQTAEAVVTELVHSLRDYADSLEFDPERTESLRLRHAELQQLIRRHGKPLDEIIEMATELEAELASMQTLDTDIQELEKEIEVLRVDCAELAERLTVLRRKGGEKLGAAVARQLKDLGIARSVFRAEVNSRPSGNDELWLQRDSARVAADRFGWDVVEFHLSTNVGEEPMPLVRVASGGEISRVMLALKSILAEHDSIPVMVFDEIDVGVSGAIARKVGEAMKNLSRNRQVIAITHLPQIAGLADRHFVVEKKVEKGRSSTVVRRLGDEERVLEVAKLFSGDSVSKSSLESARELIWERGNGGFDN